MCVKRGSVGEVEEEEHNGQEDEGCEKEGDGEDDNEDKKKYKEEYKEEDGFLEVICEAEIDEDNLSWTQIFFYQRLGKEYLKVRKQYHCVLTFHHIPITESLPFHHFTIPQY